MAKEFELSPVGKVVWEDRYAKKDELGNVVEKDVLETFFRVATAIASKEKDPKKWAKVFYDVMVQSRFCPAGRVLAHSGTHYSQLLNCFVLPFEKDSLESIMTTAKNMAIIQKFGGGCIGGESVVLTNKGPLSIKDIVENPENGVKSVLSYNSENRETEYCEILDRHITDLPGERVFQVEFEDLRGGIAARMRASDWHPFFVFDGKDVIEVRADELKPGMAVIGSTDIDPEYDDWGWLLGYLAGDGAIDPNGLDHTRVRLVDDSEECIARASCTLKVSYNPSKDKRYKVKMWECGAYGDMAERIKEEFNGYQTALTKHIPSSVWSSSAKSRFSFLVGYLDADGWFNKEKKRFEVFTVSECLCKETIALAGGLGIRTSYRFRKSSKENESDGWEVNILSSQFISDSILKVSAKYKSKDSGWVCGVLDFSSVWKDRLADSGMDVRTSEAWRGKTEVGGLTVSLAYWLQHGKATRETAAAVLRECGETKLANAVLSSQIIKSSKPTDRPETLFDLSVAKNKTYLASDPTTGAFVVVHNTGFSYSKLRPAGCYITGVNGRSCGTIGFVGMMSTVSEVIEQGGTRRGANMGCLEVWHPDVWEFISYKNDHNWDTLREFIDVKDEERWRYFKYENLYKWQMYNVSVAVSDEFLEALEKDEVWPFMWEGKEWELYKVIYKMCVSFDPENPIFKEKAFEVTADCDATAIWKVKRKVPFPKGTDKFEVISRRKVKASEVWDQIAFNAWSDGCPGIINLSEMRRMHNLEYTGTIEATNPCLIGSSLMITSEGFKKIGDLDGKRATIYNGKSWAEGEVFCSGVKPVYEVRLSNGLFLKSTLDHLVFDENDSEIEMGKTLGLNLQRSFGPSEWGGFRHSLSGSELMCLGFVFGDGNFHKASGRYKYVYIGVEDEDMIEIFNSIGESLEETDRYDRRLLSSKFADLCETLEFPHETLPDRTLSDRILQLPSTELLYFLKGLYSANGSVLKSHRRVTYKSSCRELIDQLQIILAAFNIKSYVTKNGSHKVKFENGDYVCRESYDLNITSDDLAVFNSKIGFIQEYKDQKMDIVLSGNNGRRLKPKVVSIEYIGEEKVYDFKMPEDHFAFVNGLKVHNCGEQPLPANSVCNLSSIILPLFVNKSTRTIDFDLLKETVHAAVRFSDNVIDNCEFPLPEVGVKALEERRVGLGTMGIHDMLIEMHLGYDTQEGRDLAEKVLEFIRDEAYRASIELAKEKGPFPSFDKKKFLNSGFIKTLPKDIRDGIREFGIRNGTLLTQAPTGSISAFLSFSSGCEPWYSLSFTRNTRLGSYVDGCGAYIKWEKEHPNEPTPTYFKGAAEIAPIDHVKMMIVFSKYVDSAVSKTVNLPNQATVADVKEIFDFALANGVKGLTVFRDGSKEGVLIDNKKKIIVEAKKTVQELQDMDVEPDFESRKAPRKRGGKTVGSTIRVHMQKHNLYISVNRNKDGDLVEVFATVGENKNQNANHTSGVEDSWAEGLAKMISLALRAGVDVNSIIRNLKNIPSDKPVFTTIGDNESSEMIPSPPHAIARAIEEEVMNPIVLGVSKGVVNSQNPSCVSCGSTNTIPDSPTCYACQDCGYKGCG